MAGEQQGYEPGAHNQTALLEGAISACHSFLCPTDNWGVPCTTSKMKGEAPVLHLQIEMLLCVGKDCLPRKTGIDVSFYSIPKYSGGSTDTCNAIFNSPGYPIQPSDAGSPPTPCLICSPCLGDLHYGGLTCLKCHGWAMVPWHGKAALFLIALQLHPAVVTTPYLARLI